MSIEKRAEIDEALESEQRFKGFIDDAPNALNLINERIEELSETINGQIQSINTNLSELEARVTALEQAQAGGQ